MNFTNTSINMVQTVTNIVEGYKMGSFRALAQEPVQNALDAICEEQKRVEVEYRLLRRLTASRRPCYLLAVTDTGTTGLRGPMVSAAELEARHFKLKPEENWAAFEAQGYTKENEDALGSRGQGKAAFLYHSHIPGETRRMLTLYDTLLANGEYRLGMRFARPVDQILSPPLSNEEAKATIQREMYQLDDTLDIPLGLRPLNDIGTRVIVPYLAEEHLPEMRPNGELSRWLQRCWWRAIQTGKLRIRIVDEIGNNEEIAVPNWWQDLPPENKPSTDGNWHDLLDGGRACVWSDLPLDNKHKIRRLVLLHSDELPEDKITQDPEFSGIQQLRGSQWIETRGAREDYGDFIPPDKRPGFRGYVEFATHSDIDLRESENSQHDGFDGRRPIVRNIRDVLKAKVHEFSEIMGWEPQQSIPKQQVSQREMKTHTRFLETFLNPNGRKPSSVSSQNGPETPQLLWDCRLDLDYPDQKSARVDWGQAIRNLYVEVAFEPGDELIGSADLLLEWVDAKGDSQEISRREGVIRKEWNSNLAHQQFELGDWKIFRGTANQPWQIECPEPGECKLRAVVEHRGERVTSASRTVYVQSDPPPPPTQQPITLSINTVNDTDGTQRRIDHGQVLHFQINARNRTTQADTYYLTATLSDEIFAKNTPVELEGTPAGDTPRKQSIMIEKRQLLSPQQSAPMKKIDGIQSLVLPDTSGIYHIRAELANENGEPVVTVAKPVYFQRDPSKAKSALPFELEQVVERAKPMWNMNEELTILRWSTGYPLYNELPVPLRQRRALQGKLAFIAEISANGLLEWALRPKEQGDDSNYDQLLEDIGSQSETLWDKYSTRLEKLGNTSVESRIEFGQTWRETVAIMLEIFHQQENN